MWVLAPVVARVVAVSTRWRLRAFLLHWINLSCLVGLCIVVTVDLVVGHVFCFPLQLVWLWFVRCCFYKPELDVFLILFLEY